MRKVHGTLDTYEKFLDADDIAAIKNGDVVVTVKHVSGCQEVYLEGTPQYDSNRPEWMHPFSFEAHKQYMNRNGRAHND